MSRTDKDAPWWVRSEWYEPVHFNCPNTLGYLIWRWRPAKSACDLPTDPVRYNPRLIRRWRPREQTPCYWEAEWPYRDRYRYTHGPTKEDRHLGWYGPDRARVRDQLLGAKKEHHAHGDVEIVGQALFHHHRHASIKGWWD